MRVISPHMRRSLIPAIGIILFLLVESLFAGGGREPESAAVQVFVSIAPQEYLISSKSKRTTALGSA